MAESQEFGDLEKGVRGSNIRVVDEEVSFRTAGASPNAINKGDRAAEPVDRADVPEKAEGGWNWGNPSGQRRTAEDQQEGAVGESGGGPGDGAARLPSPPGFAPWESTEKSDGGRPKRKEGGAETQAVRRGLWPGEEKPGNGGEGGDRVDIPWGWDVGSQKTGDARRGLELGRRADKDRGDLLGGMDWLGKEQQGGDGRAPGAGGDREWRRPGLKPVSKPTRFDGTGDLVDYFNHFDLCVKINRWSDKEAGMFLGLSLDGQARRLLSGIQPATAEGYRKLREALLLRYEPPNQKETYKALLRTRVRKPGESMQALQQELMKYTRLAYPEAEAKTVDALVLDRFLTALGDGRLKQWVYQSQPADLQAAVMTAIGAEAYLQSDADDKQRVRSADATVTEQMKAQNDKMDKMTATLMAALDGLAKKAESTATPRKRQTGCFHCQQEGHFKRECPLLVGQKVAEAATATAAKPAGVTAAPATGAGSAGN